MISLVQYVAEALEEDVTTNKKFKKWFGKSKLHKKGKPTIYYHGTKTKFNEFFVHLEMGAHFGDKEAAKQINHYSGRGSGDSYIMPVYLRVENPLRMIDLEVFDIFEMLDYFQNEAPNKLPKDGLQKVIDKKNESDAVELDGAKSIRLSEKLEADADLMMKDLIKASGYDSIVYKNTREGNADSYIIFDQNQIKSIYNDGNYNKSGNIYK